MIFCVRVCVGGDVLCKWGQRRIRHTAVTSAFAHPEDDIIKQACFCPKFEAGTLQTTEPSVQLWSVTGICVHRCVCGFAFGGGAPCVT